MRINTKPRTFLCLNGPYNNKRKTHTELYQEKLLYSAYNNTEGYIIYNRAGKGVGESMLFIWWPHS